ncbi:UNVERIFIED_CONTAM: hypothetical protein K2H54_042473 [Gekko kuhli]
MAPRSTQLRRCPVAWAGSAAAQIVRLGASGISRTAAGWCIGAMATVAGSIAATAAAGELGPCQWPAHWGCSGSWPRDFPHSPRMPPNPNTHQGQTREPPDEDLTKQWARETVTARDKEETCHRPP